MAPELVSAFVEGYQEAVQEEQQKTRTAHVQIEKRKSEIDRKISGIFKAIEDGLYEPSMKDRLDELKTQREDIALESLVPGLNGGDKLYH